MRADKLIPFGVALLCATSLIALRAADTTAGNKPRVAGLEEVVVTARRREENIQTVPIAITAFSQESLQQNHIQSIDDLQYFTPGLNFNAGIEREQGSI